MTNQAMKFARTVLGDVPASELGHVNAHEHLAISNGLITVQHPEYRLDSLDKAVEEVEDFVNAGGRTIVDCAPCGVGRNPDILVNVARSTGVRIIAATGLHKDSYYLDSHWRFRYTTEQMANLWAEEIEDGMEISGYEGPLIFRSSARAGVIKIATDYQRISKATRVACEAAALAHHRTGAPILTHSDVGTMMLEQIELFRSLGVAPRHLIISHADRNPDWVLHRDVAQSGAFMEYDCPGRVKYFPEITIVNLLAKMFELSLGAHIVLGGDNAHRSYWRAYGGGPGISYIFRKFIPRLKRDGFSDEQICALTVNNPAESFSFAMEREIPIVTESNETKLAHNP